MKAVEAWVPLGPQASLQRESGRELKGGNAQARISAPTADGSRATVLSTSLRGSLMDPAFPT